MFVDLNGYSYKDRTESWYASTAAGMRDRDGNEMEPDTVTGNTPTCRMSSRFSAGHTTRVFNILMQDDKIASLMAPFKSAYENKANDQLEGMVGTLRVSTARLRYRTKPVEVFTGDDFDLKVSDGEHPTYRVIANDLREGAGHQHSRKPRWC